MIPIFKTNTFLPFSNLFRIQQVTNDFVSAISTPFKPKRPEHLSLKKSLSSDETNEKRPNFYIPKADEGDFTFSVPRNHFMSPFWAPDELLKDFPPMRILVIRKCSL